MTPSTIVAELRSALEAELPAAVALRHAIHRDPEPSGSEWRTSRRVSDAIGLGPGTRVAETGRLIRVGGTRGPSIAVRGELDALPAARPGASEDTPGNDPGTGGYRHVCGHDVHLAAVAALTRAAAAVQVPVPLVAVLQPREERPPSGARDIVASKVLVEHDVRAVVGAHVQPILRQGEIAATPGAVNAAADQFEIVVTGHGGHGGYPHLTHDPVVALAHVIVALQQVVSRRIDPIHSAVLTIGTVHAGSAANVIPDEARAEGTLRALDEDDRLAIHRDLATIAEGVAAAYGCRVDVRIHDGEPVLVNDPVLTARSHAWLDQLGYRVATSLRSCGADDFSQYGPVAPTLMMFVGVDQAGADRAGAAPPPMLHHPGFHPPDEAVGDVASALLAGYLAAADMVAERTR